MAILTPDLAVGGFSIEVPDLPGVITEADSIPEARKMITDAIRGWLGASRANKNPITVPVHKGRTLKEGTARGILKAAGVSEDELFHVY